MHDWAVVRIEVLCPTALNNSLPCCPILGIEQNNQNVKHPIFSAVDFKSIL